MEKISYKKASTYYLVGNLFNKGMAFLTVPIFTRILSTTDYGIITTYNSWIAILSIILGSALYMGIRAAFIDYKAKIDDFMSVTTTFTLISGLLMSLFILLGSIFLRINIGLTLLILCLLQGLASALVQNYSMYLMMKYQYKFRTFLMIMPNLLSTIASIFAILFIVKEKLYLGRIVPTAIINILFGIWITILIYKRSQNIFNKKYINYGLKISLPLVLHGIALNILSQLDRTMITWLADASQTGIYSLVYNFSMLATVITTALEGVWVPWFTSKLKTKKIKEINKNAKNYIMLMTHCMIILILIGPEIIKILATEKYWGGINIIPPIVLANYIIFAYTLYVNIEHYYKKTIYISFNTLIAALVNLILNYLLIPKYGYTAAAYTTLISYLVAFILHARYAKKLEANLYPLKTFIKPFFCILISVIIFYFAKDYFVIRWSTMLIYVLIIMHLERNEIVKYLNINNLFDRMKGRNK